MHPSGAKADAIGIGAGIVGAVLLLNGALTQRALSARLAEAEAARANETVAVQRQRDLIPGIADLVQANLVKLTRVHRGAQSPERERSDTQARDR